MKKFLLILVGLVLSDFVIIAQNEKWGLFAVKTENKDYLVTKLNAHNGVRYIAYCPNHQIILFKYKSDVYSNVNEIYTSLINNDEKLGNVIIQKTNADDENTIKELIHFCDFDTISGDLIKKELETN